MRRSEDMPDWVYWGLFGLNARWMAQVFLWLCVGLSAAAGLASPRVSGRILAERTGHGVADARVRLGTSSSMELAGEESEVRTDGEGRYLFSELQPRKA